MRQDLREAIGEFRRDPANARFRRTEDVGGCLVASRAFARILRRRGVPYAIRRYAALPGWRTTMQHVVEVDGLVVDWIAPQYRTNGHWPDVRPVAAFAAEFGAPLDVVCPACGAPGDLRRDLTVGPLSDHACRGPA